MGLKKKKRLSLADRIALANTENTSTEELEKEQALIKKVASFSKKPSQEQLDTKGQLDKDLSQKSTSKKAASCELDDSFVSQCTLSPLQQVTYLWFKNRGVEGLFNKGQIHRETGMNPPTIRKCIDKLVGLKIIEIGDYNPSNRLQGYKINLQKKVNILSYLSTDQPDTKYQVDKNNQLDIDISSNKTERKILNNLSILKILIIGKAKG